MAFEVEAARWSEVHQYLVDREMDRGVYREAMRPIQLGDGRVVTALAFLVEERHVQYAGRLEIAEQVRLVRSGVGESGPNPEYVLETARHLEQLGIRDRYLAELVEALNGTDLPMVTTGLDCSPLIPLPNGERSERAALRVRGHRARSEPPRELAYRGSGQSWQPFHRDLSGHRCSRTAALNSPVA